MSSGLKKVLSASLPAFVFAFLPWGCSPVLVLPLSLGDMLSGEDPMHDQISRTFPPTPTPIPLHSRKKSFLEFHSYSAYSPLPWQLGLACCPGLEGLGLAGALGLGASALSCSVSVPPSIIPIPLQDRARLGSGPGVG